MTASAAELLKQNEQPAPGAQAAAHPTALFRSLKVLAVVRSSEVRNALTGIFGDMHGSRLDLRVGQLAAVGPQGLGGDHADVLLFELDAEDPDDVVILQRIRHDKGSDKIILVTSPHLGTAGVRQLLRDGVDDFIPQPMERGDIIEALEMAARKLQQRRLAMPPRGKVFAFLKACGGVGTTTLAVQTALGLQQPRRRGGAKPETCLLDLDLQFGTAALYLDLESKSEIVDIIRSPERMDGELVRGAMSQHKSGLSVLTAPITPVPLEALTAETAARLVEVARSEFDYVILDLPALLTTWLEPVLSKTDCAVLVTQLTVPAIRQTRRLIEILEEEGFFNLPLILALNRYRWQWGEGVRLKQAEQALKRPFDFYIPNDYRLVVDAINQGVPLHEVRRRNKVSKRVRQMADACLKRIAQRQEEAAAVQVPVAK